MDILIVLWSVMGIISLVITQTFVSDENIDIAELRTRYRILAILASIGWPLVVSFFICKGIYLCGANIGHWLKWEYKELYKKFGRDNIIYLNNRKK